MKQVIVAHANKEFRLPNGFHPFAYDGKIEEQDAITEAVVGNQYTKVAEVTIETNDRGYALEQAFEKTNHIVDSWLHNAEVTRVFKTDARSTSVGDVMIVDGKMFIIANFGFHEVDVVEHINRRRAELGI